MSLPSQAQPISTPTMQRRTVHRRRTPWFTIIGFLAPATCLFLFFVPLPIIQAAYYSLYRWNGLGPLQDFVGISNYLRVLQDRVFRQALVHNLMIVALSVGIQLPFALGLALLVGRSMRGRAFFRTLFFLPYVLSEVVAGIMWSYIYHPQFGLLNALLTATIPGFEPQSWLGDQRFVLLAIFFVMSWKYFGLHFMLYTTGLQQVNPEVEEAARIDGAHSFNVIRHVTIPLLQSTISLSVFLSVLGSLQYFDLIWAMSLGGPVHASETMATYLVSFGFQRFAFGYGSAVAVVMFLLCFGFAIIYQRKTAQRDW